MEFVHDAARTMPQLVLGIAEELSTASDIFWRAAGKRPLLPRRPVPGQRTKPFNGKMATVRMHASNDGK